MAYTQRDNSGTAFRNDRKREGKQDPDFTGSGVINGEAVWIDIWTKPPKDDKKGFFSISFRPKDARPERPDDPAKRQHDISKPRHMPPPPLHHTDKPEPPLDRQNPETGEYEWDAQEK